MLGRTVGTGQSMFCRSLQNSFIYPVGKAASEKGYEPAVFKLYGLHMNSAHAVGNGILLPSRSVVLGDKADGIIAVGLPFKILSL